MFKQLQFYIDILLWYSTTILRIMVWFFAFLELYIFLILRKPIPMGFAIITGFWALVLLCYGRSIGSKPKKDF